MSEWWNVPCRIIIDRYFVFAAPDGKELEADIFRPDTDEPRPGIVCCPGGGWRSCNHRNFEPISIVLASWGYVTMIPRYRVAPADPWPCCMQDMKTAVRWFRAHSADYGLIPDKIGALGNSAGGHLAAMLAVTPGDEHFGGTEYTEHSSGVQAAICMAATVDMTAQHGHREGLGVTVSLLGGTPEEVPDAYREASPITYVSKNSAPMFFVHGEVDPIVPLQPVLDMSNRLRELGVDSPCVTVPDIGHGVMKEHIYKREGQTDTDKIREFLAKHLG